MKYRSMKQLFYIPPLSPTFLSDINECSMQGVCQNGDCLNTLGSFKCSCKAGWVLERNGCVGEYLPHFCPTVGSSCTERNPPPCLLPPLRFGGSGWAGPVLPDSLWVAGLRACTAQSPDPGDVLLHRRQGLGTPLWALSSHGHRWVKGVRVDRDRTVSISCYFPASSELV